MTLVATRRQRIICMQKERNGNVLQQHKNHNHRYPDALLSLFYFYLRLEVICSAMTLIQIFDPSEDWAEIATKIEKHVQTVEPCPEQKLRNMIELQWSTDLDPLLREGVHTKRIMFSELSLTLYRQRMPNLRL